MVAEWGRSAEFSVYLQDAVDAGRARARSRPRSAATRSVAGVEAVSKDAALARFRRDFPDLAPATAGDVGQSVPRVVRGAAGLAVGQRRGARAAGAGGWRRCRASPTSATTAAGSTASRRSAASSAGAGSTLAAVLILAAALTVTNVVRLALYARRDEVEIMELVGAPMAFIRGPFVFEGIDPGRDRRAARAARCSASASDVARPRLAALAAGVVDVPAHRSSSRGAPSALVVLGGMVVGCLGGLVAARRLR